MDLGRFLIRGVVGPLFVGHGTQKLFGWFDGHGPDGTGGFFESLGLRPGKRHAQAAGAAETAGGVLLTLGALTPLASTIISSVMITAIRKAHVKQGPWVTNGGYEYNLTLIAAMAVLTETGPGRPSVDAARFPSLRGSGWALAALGAAAAGSYTWRPTCSTSPSRRPRRRRARPTRRATRRSSGSRGSRARAPTRRSSRTPRGGLPPAVVRAPAPWE
jgi:putative oxidoreductase